MRLAIMQPYFFPYIGYFQLLAAVDLFIVYDNIQYSKKGWINRNRILQNGKDVQLTLPLKSASDYLNIDERELAADFNADKLLNQVKGAYRPAPYFAETLPLIDKVLRYDDYNLFRFLHHALIKTNEHLGIGTAIQISSELSIDHSLTGQDKVLALCEYVGATTYINAIGGTSLYDKAIFNARGIDLQFLQAQMFDYPQFGAPFVPWLSIIDVMMFNPLTAIQAGLLTHYQLL